MSPVWIVLAALDGAALVVLGAAGGHGVISDPALIRLFDTAADYQAWHMLALLGIGFGGGRLFGTAKWLISAAGAAFLVGSALFCGSLYVHALSGSAPLPWAAPIGGTIMILGWVALAAAGLALLRARSAD
ncbi:MAG: DUF423 domain-containing protein [Proteobacteria bacterium]|nr:DUF423 domain-containing protein [Pseudomonadota bacterium]MDA1059738.1 DUF423 domain-containing protein [Pseudomonadota bacterium]